MFDSLLRPLAFPLSRRFFVFGFVLSSCLLASAQPRGAGEVRSSSQSRVQSELKAFRVTLENGKEVLKPATSAKPGDLVEYQARYTNATKAAVGSLSPSLPVPEGMVYAANSARPRVFQASTDGAKFAAAPLRRTVRGADGKPKVVFVPLSQYRVLRWNLGTLAPGATKSVSARMRLRSAGDSPPATR